jgi:hypothetical protein
MKKTLFMIMFAAIVAGNINAQNNKEPKREVLFTLGEHEVIVYDEYVLGMALNGYKFAAIVKNTQTSKFSLVFNGKRVYETKSLPHKGNEDAYALSENERHSHVIPIYAFNVEYINPAIENGYAYWYTLAGRRFFNVVGKTTTNLPYDGDISIADDGKFAFSYRENNKYYTNMDGTIFGPYQDIWHIATANNGKFAFSYLENDKYYANIDGTIFGPYQNVWGCAIANNGKFAFAYRENDKYYANLDGTIFGHYQNFRGVTIADNGKFTFAYKENGKWHYNIHGNEVSESAFDIAWAEIQKKHTLQKYFHNPGEKRINYIKSNDGKHMFYSDWEYAYVVIDGQEVGEHTALYAYYDEQKNAFIWNAIEGKELVVYEYKL